MKFLLYPNYYVNVHLMSQTVKMVRTSKNYTSLHIQNKNRKKIKIKS